MNQNIDLKELERKTFLSYHQDGLADILFGLFIILSGVKMLNDTFVFTFFFAYIIISIAAYYCRKNITIPRVGMVKFNRKRMANEQRKLLFVLIIACILFVLCLVIPFYFFFHGTFDVLITNSLLINALLMGIFQVFFGLFFGMKRMYLYAALIFLFYVPGKAVMTDDPTRVIITGTVLLVSGLVILTEFLIKNPVLTVEEGS